MKNNDSDTNKYSEEVDLFVESLYKLQQKIEVAVVTLSDRDWER